MSDLGLNTGYYTDIRDFAELLDDALVELKSKGVVPRPRPRPRSSELGRLLCEAGTERVSGRLPQFVSMLLQEYANSEGRGHALGERLIGGVSDSADLAWLETLAKVVENERAETFAKMRGK